MRNGTFASFIATLPQSRSLTPCDGRMEKEKEALVKQYGLTEQKLQTKCSEEHLLEVATFIDWQKVGPWLENVGRQAVEDIDHEGYDQDDKRAKLMDLWEKRNGGSATYDQLITAMLKAKNRSNAEAVCKMLNATPTWRMALMHTLPPAPKNIFCRSDSVTHSSPRLLVIAGEAGSGVHPLLERLFKTYPNKFQVCVPYTSRPIKEGETQGKEFYFKTKEEMQKGIEDDDFLERVEYADAMYGTSKTEVRKIQSSGKICILEVGDMQRVYAIKEQKEFKTFLVFIHSPCNQPDKAKRSTFDRVILNNKEDKAFKLLTAALTAERDFSEILSPPEQPIQTRMYYAYQAMKNYAIVIVLATLLGVYTFPLEF